MRTINPLIHSGLSVFCVMYVPSFGGLPQLEGIFSTKENAKEAIKEYSRSGYSDQYQITERVIDRTFR